MSFWRKSSLMLDVESIHFAFEEKSILKGVSFRVSKGEIIALIGISGSGKTTLFRLINGLLKPTRGKITTYGETTFMRQEDLLLPWRTVLNNLLLFTELGKSQPENPPLEEAYALLRKVGLEGYAEVYPHQLSGGMRQRVALARALLQNRPLMLLDEPFASLDVIIREQLYRLMRDIRDQYNKTIVMVTHDFRDAMELADRILVLSEGKIAAEFKVSDEKQEVLAEQIRSALLASL